MSEAEDGSGKVSNLTAVEAISARLAEVTRLAEKLDAKLCEAGARTRPIPMSSSAMSSTSSLFSTSTAVPSTTTSTSSYSHPISAGVSSFGTTVVSTTPSIVSSASTVQLQPKSISTILSSTTAKSTPPWSSSTSTLETSTTATSSSNETVCSGDSVVRVLSPVLEKVSREAGTGSEAQEESGFDRVADGDSGELKETAEVRFSVGYLSIQISYLELGGVARILYLLFRLVESLKICLAIGRWYIRLSS